MPNIYDMIKKYDIRSEEDIPEKYREEIEKRLGSKKITELVEMPEITSGNLGQVVSRRDEIEDIFKSEQDFYFGHGTSGGEETISLILQNGLKTVNPEAVKSYGNTLRGLDSTTILFGEGTDSLFGDQEGLLDNWPHKNSKNIVIVSIPQKYALRNTDVREADLYEAFYVGSEEEGYTLRPEFIKGIYNANSHTFAPNDNFYQNLGTEQQEKLFEEIRQHYIKSYVEHSFVPPNKTTNPLPLDETELEQVTIEWYAKQLECFRQDKIFNAQALDTELHEMAEGCTISDFNDTARSIREHAQEDKEPTNEGWSLDDEW